MLESPRLLRVIFDAMQHPDPVIKMRAADAAEKVSRLRPECLLPYKEQLIEQMTLVPQKEVRWHVAAMLSYLHLDRCERKRILKLLATWLEEDESQIVKVNSMQALADVAGGCRSLRETVVRAIERAVRDGGPAVRSRGKRILRKLHQKDRL